MKLSSTLRQRFENKIVPQSNGCINWVGIKSNVGYGMISIATGISRGVHRVAWFLHYGYWPTQSLRHTCDNMLCVNIDHLIEGTQQDNIQDKVDRDRQAHGPKHGMAKLTTEDVQSIRIERKNGTTLKDLSEKYNSCQSNISYICRNATRKRA